MEKPQLRHALDLLCVAERERGFKLPPGDARARQPRLEAHALARWRGGRVAPLDVRRLNLAFTGLTQNICVNSKALIGIFSQTLGQLANVGSTL